MKMRIFVTICIVTRTNNQQKMLLSCVVVVEYMNITSCALTTYMNITFGGNARNGSIFLPHIWICMQNTAFWDEYFYRATLKNTQMNEILSILHVFESTYPEFLTSIFSGFDPKILNTDSHLITGLSKLIFYIIIIANYKNYSSYCLKILYEINTSIHTCIQKTLCLSWNFNSCLFIIKNSF